MTSISDLYSEVCLEKNIELFPLQKSILDRFYNDDHQRLIAVLGRRSGKDLLISLIAIYEVIRALEIKNISEIYNMEPQPVHIVVLSNNKHQSKTLLSHIREIALKIDVLRNSINDNSTNENAICFSGYNKNEPIILMSSHVENKHLRGNRVFALLMNDIESYIKGGRAYAAVAPATYGFQNPSTGKMDSKIIAISSPTEIMRKFYNSKPYNGLRVQYPTWEVNPNLSKQTLRERASFMSDSHFAVEFGAEFPPNNNQTVSIRLPEHTIAILNELAREISFNKHKNYTYNDLIRTCIEDGISKRIHGI